MTAPLALANPVFCAVDVADVDAARSLARAIAPHVGGLKLGLEFFCAEGPGGVRAMAEIGLPIFLDLKLHDIPNTVAKAVETLLPLRPAFLTLHAGGGRAMMAAAAEAAAKAGPRAPRLLAVSVLTSLNEADLADLGIDATPSDQVQRLAALARAAGIDGLVASPQEVAPLRRQLGPGLTLVVPGIRLDEASRGDQKRVATPEAALADGADILVIGRPITASADPAAAAAAIAARIRSP